MPNRCWNMTQLRIKLVKEIVEKKRKIQEVSSILWVSRQSVGKWKWKYLQEWERWLIPLKPWPKSWETHNRTNELLEGEVCRIGKENPFEWPVWISDQIDELYSISINQSTVYRILKRRNIRYYYGYHGSKKKRILYVKDIPWRELQLDVSFPWGYQRKLCIYTAIDDASRFVISWIYTNHTEVSTLHFVKRVISESKYKVRAFRTDQGREFSQLMTDYLETQDIEHNKNPPYTPQHNGKVERYHRTMKEKCCMYWKFDADKSELDYSLLLWTNHYNSRKKHYWLGMKWKTPEEKLIFFKKINPLLVPLM